MMGPPFALHAPHVVILGAGASKAALLNGDAHGKMIPLLDDLPDILGLSWKRLIAAANAPIGNFETIYAWLKGQSAFESDLRTIEESLHAYFASLILPDRPTIYDYLVLGLRGKDLVATFNWDPFLMQAHRRNRDVAQLPDIRFLHGSVEFSTCEEHDILGGPKETCPHCGMHLKPGKLFYPEATKDYAADSLIKRDWDAVSSALKKAFHFTIFGYSGPVTDFSARKLLGEAWQQTPMLPYSHVEIIDIEESDVLRRRWANYIPHNHDMIESSFWESSVARWPRRTAEWKISASLYGMPAEDIRPLRTDSLAELQEWFRKLAKVE